MLEPHKSDIIPYYYEFIVCIQQRQILISHSLQTRRCRFLYPFLRYYNPTHSPAIDPRNTYLLFRPWPFGLLAFINMAQLEKPASLPLLSSPEFALTSLACHTFHDFGNGLVNGFSCHLHRSTNKVRSCLLHTDALR